MHSEIEVIMKQAIEDNLSHSKMMIIDGDVEIKTNY